MQRVVVDANVLVSYFIDRIPHQGDAADALLRDAEGGEITAIVPQFFVFEATYVLQNQYGVTGDRLASMIRDIITFPGAQIVDQCPWRLVLEMWPHHLISLADAAIVALTTNNRYEAVATFDRKLARRLKELGLATYW